MELFEGYLKIVFSSSAVYLFKFLLFQFPKLGNIVQGTELMLIYKGQLNESNMVKARITREELSEAVREHGVAEIQEVDLAILEIDGNISIISNNYKHRTIRKRKGRNKVMKNQ